MSKLTAKHKRFCEQYIIDLNAGRAAERAGYSKKTADQAASRLLRNVKIADYIKELQKKLSDKTEITAEKVIAELAKIGFSNVQDYINGGNTVLDISEIDENKAAAVSSIKKSTTHFGNEKTQGTKETVEFKLWDKTDALEKLGKHLGIFERDNAQKQFKFKVSVKSAGS